MQLEDIFDISFVKSVFSLCLVRNGGGGQNFERLKFRNFKVANIKMTKDEFSDSVIIEFIYSFFKNYLKTQNM